MTAAPGDGRVGNPVGLTTLDGYPGACVMLEGRVVYYHPSGVAGAHADTTVSPSTVGDSLIGAPQLVGPELRSVVQDHSVAHAVVDLEVIDEDKRVGAAAAVENEAVVTTIGLAVRNMQRPGCGNHRNIPGISHPAAGVGKERRGYAVDYRRARGNIQCVNITAKVAADNRGDINIIKLNCDIHSVRSGVDVDILEPHPAARPEVQSHLVVGEVCRVHRVDDAQVLYRN